MMSLEYKTPMPIFPCLNCGLTINVLKQSQPPLFCSDDCRHEAEFIRFARKVISGRQASKIRILRASKQWFAYLAGSKELPEEGMEAYLEDLFHRIEAERPLKDCDDEKKWYKAGMQKILSQRIKQYPVSEGEIFSNEGKPLIGKGVVKWFLDEEGHGIIKQDGGGEIVVHYTGINKTGFKTLIKGERVAFDIEKGIKGPRAVNVTGI